MESSAVSALSGSDETKVLDAISIAGGSASYWAEHGDEWDAALCDLGHCGGTFTTASPGSGWRILAADLFGLVCAGTFGAAIGSSLAFLQEFT